MPDLPFPYAIPAHRAVNIDPDTAIHYGVIASHSLDCEILNGMSQNGTDLGYENAKEDLKQSIAKFIEEHKRRDNMPNVDSAIDDLADALLEDAETNGPYDFKMEGVEGRYSPDSGVVMIFKSPVIVSARACSPCYPNAGDLDNCVDFGSTGYNVMSEVYGVPEDWKYKAE